MSLQWSSETFEQIAAHAARVAAYLRERESEKVCSSEAIQCSTVISTSSSPSFHPIQEKDRCGASAVSLHHRCFANELHVSPERKAERLISREQIKTNHGITSVSSDRSMQSRVSTEPTTDSGLERIRQQDREKKRVVRSNNGELIRQLDSLLHGEGGSGGSRTLHEILAAASSAVQCIVGPDTMRS